MKIKKWWQTPPVTYTFKSHEQPAMIGSPGVPDHPYRRKVFYALVGIVLAITGGMQNGLLTAVLPQLQGSLALTPAEGGWILVTYNMVNACMSMLLFKCRQQFGLARFIRAIIFALVLCNLIQVTTHSYHSELLARGISGLAASGMNALALFYFIQAMPMKWRLKGIACSISLSQVALPFARAIAPTLMDDGNLQAVFWLQLGMSLNVLVLVSLLPLPHGYTQKAISKTDLVSLLCFALGVAALCAFFVQGRIVWWDKVELGQLLLVALIGLGITLLIELNRKEPMIKLDWLRSKELLWLGLTAAFLRMVMSEQNVGSAGFLTALGMGNTQMVTYYWVLTAGALTGLAVTLWLMEPQNLKPPVMLAFFCIAVGAFLDVGANSLTRPSQTYVSQFLIAMASVCFVGPLMIEGMLRAFSKSPAHIITFIALFGLSQTIGGLLGSAALSAFLTIRTKEHLTRFGEQLSSTDPTVAARIQAYAAQYQGVIGDGAMRQSQGVASVVAQAQQQATVLAYNDSFWLFGLVATCGFLFVSAEWAYYKYHGTSHMAPVLAELARKKAKK